NKMKIRKAGKNDLKEIGKLMLKEFSKPPFNERASLKDVLKSLKFYFKNSKIYFSKKEEEIAGIIVFQIEQWWEGKVIIIQDLAVKEKFQKQNIGENLMKFLEDYAKKKKIKRIYFETNKKSSSVKFYQKLGYKINKDRIAMNKKT
ncbi:unnamed protein product, partial [marine sediment metagenome]